MTVDRSAPVQSLYLLQKVILLFFIFSVKRGLKAATLLGIFRYFWNTCWTVRFARWASSGNDSLSWPAVMAGYFLICLWRIKRKSSGSYFFLPELFFLGDLPFLERVLKLNELA